MGYEQKIPNQKLLNLTSGKRTVICTFIALASGFFGASVGGQISMTAHTEKCSVGMMAGLLKPFCQWGETPGAMWQGSTTGLWTGTILGAFIGGLATHRGMRADL